MTAAVAPGTRLGPYEIISRIGAGGMGEVWKATDTRLDRSVAIKVLPASLASDPQFRARFEREAKTISQLSHPNICVLHDVGQTAPSSGAGESASYLVMELLEGETLASRLLRGPLPLDQVLRIGAQIADALDMAHRNNVVHRDLKPANVMLTKSGAKLLDFGLARNVQIAPWGTESATVARNANAEGSLATGERSALTAEGTIVGTFQYMAPEQLEGAVVDARTDIFALGSVLYEMATGRRAFDGKTKTSIIAAIVDRQPRPIHEFQPLTPPAFEHVVARCLAKSPDDRWQSAHDVAEELSWIREAGSQAGAAVSVTTRRRNRERAAWVISAVVAVVAIIATTLAWRASRAAAPPRVMRFTIPGATTPMTDVYGLIAVSPDGNDVVYVAVDKSTTRLFRRSLDKKEAIPIEGTEGGLDPFFSPDGRWIAFFARHHLMKVALSGGEPIAIGKATEPRGGVWADDDTIFYCPFYYGGIERISASGGPSHPVSTVDRAHGEVSHRWPRLLPGGKVVIYTIGYGGSWDDAKIVAQRLDNGERKVLVNGGCDGRYVPAGHLVYVRGTSLYAVPFDAKKLEVTGPPEEVASGVANNSAGSAEFAFAANGMLVYFSPGASGDEGGVLSIVNRRGEKQPGILPAFPIDSPEFSPDGTKLVGIRGAEVWTFDLVRGTSTRITSEARTLDPVWSSDGTRVIYSSERNGPWNPYWQAADRSGVEEQIVKSTDSMEPLAMSSDGRELLVLVYHKETGADLMIVSMADRHVRPFAQTEADEAGGVFSPDGKWIAFWSDESGRYEIYVRSSTGAPGRWQISTDGGLTPKWVTPNEIVYLNSNRLMSVAVRTEPAFSAAQPQLVLEKPLLKYDVARDGRIVIAEAPATSSAPGLNVVLNWFEEIRQRSEASGK